MCHMIETLYYRGEIVIQGYLKLILVSSTNLKKVTFILQISFPLEFGGRATYMKLTLRIIVAEATILIATM